MAGPRTRIRSKTPDPAWAPGKNTPPGRALKKAHDELKKKTSSASPGQRRLTFSPVATVTQIEAENRAPSKSPPEGERPAMSLTEADKVLERAPRRFNVV